MRAGGLPEVVRPEVLLEGPLEEDRVRLDAARPDPEVDRGVVLVLDVEQDADVVLVVVDAVAVDEGRPELRDVGVLAPERDVEELVVVSDLRERLDRGRRVVARVDLVGEGDLGGLGPARVREVPVDADGRGDPRHPDLRFFVGRRRLLGLEPKRPTRTPRPGRRAREASLAESYGLGHRRLRPSAVYEGEEPLTTSPLISVGPRVRPRHPRLGARLRTTASPESES